MMEMTRASATPAQGSASLPGSERATPTYAVTGMGPRTKHFGSNSNLRASDFGAKIKQLEELGCRLRGEVDGILKEKDDHWRGDGGRHSQIMARKRGMSPPETRVPALEHQPYHDENNSRSLRDLTDITNEQRTIEAMKSRLEEHSLHAECLQSRARAPSPVRSSLAAPCLPPAARRLDLMLPPSILERELRECRQQNDFLRSQLDSALAQHAAEAQEARQGVEELKARLFETQGRGEAAERARDEERQRHGALVAGLQASVQQLQTANREQENALLQTSHKADAAQQSFCLLEAALAQLRGVILAAEQRRGRPFLDSDPVPTQSAAMLVHCVERAVQELSADAEGSRTRLRHLETALDDARKMSDGRIADARDAETQARRRADEMEAEVRRVTDDNHVQAQDNAARLLAAKEDLERQARAWNDKRAALETALDASQRETAAAISRKDQVVQEATELESSLQKTTAQRAELKAALEEEQSRRRHSVEQCSRLERQVGVLSEEVEQQKVALVKMEDAMERSRRENAKEMTRIKQAEKEAGEREKVELQEKVYAMSEEMELTKKELSDSRLIVDQLQASLTDATERYNMTKIQIDGLSDEKGHLQSIIGNRSAEVERLTAERDYFFRCLDEKTEEVSYLKAEKQRLITQSSEMLERLEKNFFRLEDRLTDLKVMDEERTKQSGNYYQERESVQVRFAEKERELEAMRSARDSLMRRLKAKEKHVKDMEHDREHDSGELKERRMELEAVCRERNQLYLELKESRQEALNMATEIEDARRHAHEREAELERKLHEVTARLEELRLVKCSSQPEVRPSRVTPARRPTGRVQKEVATNKNQLTALQSKLKEVEEKTLALEEERRKLKEENSRLVRLLERLTSQNETLSGELEFYLGRNQELLGKVGRAEKSIDEAAQRNHCLQQQIDALETENAGLRFKLATAAIPAPPDAPSQRAAEREVRQLGENLRHTLGDVRGLLAEHSEPKSAGDSPVGRLLMESDL